ncbi:MAG: PucR family transcriptional regulator [Streptosporangiales bacterium]|nr:PucR family transcriptional regulator [Streptosporangiales bacterium]
MGTLGTAATVSMERHLPWFRTMSAENRSWVGLVAQAGIAAFVDWFKHPGRGRPAITGEVFGTAPRELTRAVTLQQTVEMVRVVIDVVETQVTELAAPGGERQLLDAVLRYAREVAFSAAYVYARAAESRGAWDARLEALIVDALVRGEGGESLQSWAAALRWSSTPVLAIAGHMPEEDPELLVDEVRSAARKARLDVLAGAQGSRLIVIVGGTDEPEEAVLPLVGHFGPGPVVIGPQVPDLQSATLSARIAVNGLRAAPGWPEAPRPVLAEDLLPERALDGDTEAREELIETAYEPLGRAGSPLLDTLTAYLEHGASLEATARMLFVHPNTVRYRLRRIAELTGYVPSEGRSAYALQIALTCGRLRDRAAAKES